MSEPLQKDLLTNRWRKVAAPKAKEYQTQISLVAQLRWGKLRAGVIFFHVPNGEERDPRVGAKLKAMGVLPGVADLIFLWKDGRWPRVLFLELKAKGEDLSEAQEWFRDNVRSIRCYFECADTIDDALKILEKYKLLRERNV
jgi:hypothetical protein